MSAIEVLKNYWEYVHSKDTLDFDSEFHNAINEALLALEQKEKLKENILRIEECLRTYDNGDYFEPDSDYEHPAEWCVFDIKKVMKEVLDKFEKELEGEQK